MDNKHLAQCKYCGSPHIVRYGTFRGVQRWWCKDCKRKFADNEALPRMKTPVKQIADCLSMYYEGMSLNAICRHLGQTHNAYPSDASVYRWVVRFSKVAIDEAKKYKPQVGSVWIADETVLKLDKQNIWFWDIIDAKTRFLLASHVSPNRTITDARILMEKAAQKAGKIPRVVMTDKLAAYIDGIELTFGADTKHTQTKGFESATNINLIERFHGTLKDRTKVMRGLKNLRTAKMFTDGWLAYYNFLRPHSAIDKTPAEKAGIKFPYVNWLEIVEKSPQLSLAPSSAPKPIYTVYEQAKYKPKPKKPKRGSKTKTRQTNPILKRVR